MLPDRSLQPGLICAALATLSVFALAVAVTAPAARASLPRNVAYLPHRVLVGYAPGPIAAVTSALETRMGIRAAPGGPPSPRTRVLRLPRGQSVAAAIRRLRRLPGVAYAEPDYIAHQAGGFYPDDRGRSGQYQGWEKMQWNLLPGTGINAPEAWANLLADHRRGGRGVVVAILDTGVAYRKWRQFRRSPDFRSTSFVAPHDFVGHNRYPLDRNGHGTFVAGIVAEGTNNKVALTGIAYGASIMPVRVLDASGLGDEATIARGIRYAVIHGARVINLSLEFLPNEVSSASDIPEIVSALNFAHARGVTVVGASGNDQSNQIAYPARVNNVISVGATTRDLCLADYSNGGIGLDLVAPGGGSDAIMPSDPSCHPERSLPSIYQLTLVATPHWGRFGYPGYYIGTSMSAPEVAATAALVIASRVLGPRPKPTQILAHLEQTATPLGCPSPATPPGCARGPDPNYGYGIINAGAATARQIVPATSG
ncbi:MAG: S8 family serine peptidase [Solirubrobacteraceae bacterium]